MITMDRHSFSDNITFSDTMNINPSMVFNSVPTLDGIDFDYYPDPDGYCEGQEELEYSKHIYAKDDDIYEPDVFEYDD